MPSSHDLLEARGDISGVESPFHSRTLGQTFPARWTGDRRDRRPSPILGVGGATVIAILRKCLAARCVSRLAQLAEARLVGRRPLV